MKFKKAPGAPKRFKSAFLFFSEYKHKEIRQQAKDKKIRAAQAAKVVSQAWKELSDADRAQFLEMGRRDRERYEREKAAYKGPWKIPDIKDPNAPKKPMSAFLAFGNERRGLIAEANPTLSNTEISSLLSKLWKECPANMKQAYRDREARERAEFKKNFAEWQRKHEEALVLDHHSNSSSSNGSDSVADDGSNSSHGTTSVTTSHHQQHESTLPQPISQEVPQQDRTGKLQQSSGSIEEEIPVDIFMPNAVVYPQPTAAAPLHKMVSDEAIIMEDGFIMPNDEAWPFDRVVPKMIALPPAASASRFANYSMDDILQDDELFFDDFSPLQVMSVTQQQQQQQQS